MKRRYIFTTLSALLWILSADGAPAKDALYFQHDGQKRLYYLYAPPSLPDNAPVIFVLHGMDGTARKIRHGLGLNAIADEYGFAIVYPQGSRFADKSTYWNAGYAYSAADDLGFLEGLAKDIQHRHGFDAQRTYVLGISNGGFMAYTLACHGVGAFQAVASVIGTIVQSDWENCTPKGPLSVLHMHGVRDKTVDFNGGVHWYPPIGQFPSAADIVDYWVKTMHMQPIPAPEPIENITFSQYSAKGGAKLLFVQMDDFGHDWPHRENAGFSATRIIMRFFADLANGP